MQSQHGMWVWETPAFAGEFEWERKDFGMEYEEKEQNSSD